MRSEVSAVLDAGGLRPRWKAKYKLNGISLPKGRIR
jgi:hypothetical protein